MNFDLPWLVPPSRTLRRDETALDALPSSPRLQDDTSRPANVEAVVMSTNPLSDGWQEPTVSTAGVAGVDDTGQTSENTASGRWRMFDNRLFQNAQKVQDGGHSAAADMESDLEKHISSKDQVSIEINTTQSTSSSEIGGCSNCEDPSATVVSIYTTWFQMALAVIIPVLLTAAWCFFWFWWVTVHNSKSWPWLDVLLSVPLLWKMFNDLFAGFLWIRAGMVNPAYTTNPPKFRIAMVVTKAPSEPADVVQKTLLGALNQDYPYPYDVWVADERPTEEMSLWCSEHGVHISSRDGVKEYHQPTWPRRTRCKEGNLAYFYDMYAYERYDLVAQFDADHVPEPNYLSSSVAAFLDPDVGFLAFPSICGANRNESWAVRGRLFLEGTFHGIHQAAHTRTWMPCAIGSHYMVRTAHLKKAGGIGPELDEDFSTSYIMSAYGFKGAFSINSIAYGDGPATFEDCMKQEYQWSRSMMILLIKYIGMWWNSKRLTWPERFHVAMVLLYYPATSCFPLGLFIWIIAPACGAQYGDWNFFDLFMHLVPQFVISYLSWFFPWCYGWLRPMNVPLMSWEGPLHSLCFTFWNLQGVIHGVLAGAFGIKFEIKVTPKGKGAERLLGVQNLYPLLCIICLCSLGLYFGTGSHHIALLIGGLHLLGAVAIPLLHYYENHHWPTLPWQNLLILSVAVGAAAGSFAFAVYSKADEIKHDIFGGFDWVYDNAGVKAIDYVIG